MPTSHKVADATKAASLSDNPLLSHASATDGSLMRFRVLFLAASRGTKSKSLLAESLESLEKSIKGETPLVDGISETSKSFETLFFGKF